jgi:two-component system phosphate regulon sensor histidine kinase PhoR
MDNHGDRPEIVAAREQGWGHSIRRSATLETDMVYTAVRLDTGDGEPAAFVRVARSLAQVEQLTASIEGTIWVAAVVVVLLGLLACYLFIERRILRQERIRPASA